MVALTNFLIMWYTRRPKIFHDSLGLFNANLLDEYKVSALFFAALSWFLFTFATELEKIFVKIFWISYVIWRVSIEHDFWTLEVSNSCVWKSVLQNIIFAPHFRPKGRYSRMVYMHRSLQLTQVWQIGCPVKTLFPDSSDSIRIDTPMPIVIGGK